MDPEVHQPMHPVLIARYRHSEDFDPNDPTLAPAALFTVIHEYPSDYVETRIREWVQLGGAATATDLDGTTILSVCAAYNHPGAVRCLLQQGANVPREGGWESTATEALSVFCGAHDSELLQIAEDLLEAGANINFSMGRYSTPLMSAAERGKGSLVRFLLQRGGKDYTNSKGQDAAALARKGYGSI